MRKHWPGKTVAVNGWGMDFSDPKTAGALAAMSGSADSIIDVTDGAGAQGEGARRRLIAGLRCAFGTVGGPQVEPPQHWSRDRWFLPTARRQCEHLAALYADGGRACEYFFHILANPGDDISFHVAGKAMRDPAAPWPRHLHGTLEELYGIGKRAVLEAFAELIVEAENAYLRHLPVLRSGTISLEPLVSAEAGPPVYVTRRLNARQRGEYFTSLERIARSLKRLAPEIPHRERVGKILTCIHNAMADVRQAG